MTPLQHFVSCIPDYDGLTHKPAQLVPFLTHFLEQDENAEPVTGQALRDLFDELRLRPPARISDVLGKSKLFVRSRSGGYRLSHQGRQHVNSELNTQGHASPLAGPIDKVVPSANEVLDKAEHSGDGLVGKNFSRRNVLVIYGRDDALRRDLFALLRAMGLHPIEFEEMTLQTGSASPYTLEVLDVAFKNVQACVVLFSPDENVTLRRGLRRDGDPQGPELQPRPNVLIEAGMAMALYPKRTLLVKIGKVRPFSDFDGKQYVNLTGSPESRNKLLGRLDVAGCEVKSGGSDWLNIGNFEITEDTDE